MVTKRGLRTYRDELYPSKELDICQENIDLFFTFMYRRHNAWRNRFIKHKPRKKWTNDKILRDFKYTNIYRQLDRGSLWAINIIIKPTMKKYHNAVKKGNKKKAKFYYKNLIWKLLVYRLCCRIETFEKIGIPDYTKFDPVLYLSAIKGVLKHHRAMTNAFLTCPCPKGMTKVEGYVLNLIDGRIKLDDVYKTCKTTDNPEDIVKALRKIRGCGGFFAYELYCDLCYSGITKFTTNDYVNIGPGCMEGLRFLYPSIGTSVSKAKEKLYTLFDDQNKHFERLGLNFKHCNYLEPVKNKLSLRSIEHSLCEFSKYWLQLRNVGKRRLKYDRWSDHPNFIVSADGISIDMDTKTYKMFKNKSKLKNRPPEHFNAILAKKDISKDELLDYFLRFIK